MRDSWTVIWRDLRLYRAQFEDRRRLLIGLAVSLAMLVAAEVSFDIHSQISRAHPYILIWVWCWLPLGSAVTLSTDAIAGERERHTLESLLASRLPTRALLLGKSLAIAGQSWLSALSLVFGALVALNLATIWSGPIVLLPASVLVAGPIVSFLVTLLGTLIALLISMDAPTVRQANFRILIATSFLPILLIFPIAVIAVITIAFVAMSAQLFGFDFPDIRFPLEPVVVVVAVCVALVVLLLTIAGLYGALFLRFTRERLLNASAGAGASTAAQSLDMSANGWMSSYGGSADDPTARMHGHARSGGGIERLRSILEDARVVGWKEIVEARGFMREWRGWIVAVAFVIGILLIQMSVVGSWYWSRDADTSLLFWLAMAAALPILIAQRSSDAVAGERERHTGEILFTTRLSHTGILLGKLGATALLPWGVTLAIPVGGLISTNLIHAGSGPYWYPTDVLLAGVGLTLGIAFFLATGGIFISLGATTVQHAARRISWFLTPLLLAPGLLLRSSLWPESSDANASLESSEMFRIAATGDLATYAMLAAPALAVASAALILVLSKRFQRGTTVFD